MSTLYQQIADELASQIDQGVFQVGDKLPSIRRLSKQKQVSIATIQSAYEQLELRQHIESRPQSGFYVRERVRLPVSSAFMLSKAAVI